MRSSHTVSTEEIQMSAVADSGNHRPQEPQSLISSLLPSDSPTSLSPVFQSLVPLPIDPTLPPQEPASDGISVVDRPEDVSLQQSDFSDRVPNSQEQSKSRATTHGLYQLSFSPWLWEITSLFIALGLLVAMLVILCKASNRSEQSWTLPITLSALVNTLSTVYRALVAYVAVEIINQEKWIWLWSTSSPLRPLRHIQSFEAGSRGLLGALKLMPLVARSSPGSLLALVVIVLSLAVGPFAQQSIVTYYRATDMGTPSLPVSHSLAGSSHDLYYRTLLRADAGMWSLTASEEGALFSALANPAGKDSAISVDCPTGNCEFPSWGFQDGTKSEDPVTHASIGMCTRCHDVSSMVSMTNDPSCPAYFLINYTEFNAPNSCLWLNMKSDQDLSWADSVLPLEKAAKMRWSFTNTTVVTMGPAADQNKTNPLEYPSALVAVTCSLYPCLRTYSASIRDGRLLEKELQSSPLYPDLGDYNGSDVYSRIDYSGLALPQNELNLVAVQSPCRVNNSIFTAENMSTAIGAVPVRILDPSNAPNYPATMAPDECIFRMNISAHSLLRAVYSEQFLNGNCSWNPRQEFEIGCDESWWLAQFWEAKTATVQSIIDRFSAIADAATHQFRLGIGRRPNSTERVYGVALEQVGYTVFRWQWFLLPALLLVIDAFLLGWMLYRSIRHRNEEMAWKGNLLPLLYYRSLFEGADGEPLEAQAGFDVRKEGGDGRLMTASDLEDASKRVFVRLRRGKSHTVTGAEERSIHRH